MIDEKVLDEIIPIKTREEIKQEIEEELKQEEFVVTNFNSGGVFYTLIMIFIQIKIELIKLLRVVLSNSFVSHAVGSWLDLNAKDFSKDRKLPTKTRGNITLTRSNTDSNIIIEKGCVFKTDKDINGEELRYLSVENIKIEKGTSKIKLLVEAEREGSLYNVPVNQITKIMTYIESIDNVTNEEDWIQKEGSDIEDDESFRSRVLNSWSELATNPISNTYKNVCEAVEGVLFVQVDDMHPRGQGTIDIIVTSTAGVASQALLEKVEEAANKVKGTYDNLLIKSSEIVEQDIEVILQISSNISDEGLVDKANSIILDMFKISKDRELNRLYKDDIVFAIRRDIQIIRSVKVIYPTEDIQLENSKVIMLGNVTITVQRV